MVSKQEAILLIIERGTGVIGPVKMMSLVSEAGITLEDGKVVSQDIDESFKKLTERFASIAPTTRITLLSLAKMHGFSIEEDKDKKERKTFLRFRNWKLFRR
ncbi:MAG: hypothetical protein K9W45_12875 [Candidatus Heimdallarchaeum aukensis]|uniref:Uncharacterized protein n=1 Tax=Candidatus Heimdallarchaeum aukensis TaxID=2876573 RepID=A0A9Y1BM02_9ARCH|nr:MAG: hypothetical protein K9W45_12875 [Candidatus Heimdallarchaeum aukensis]